MSGCDLQILRLVIFVHSGLWYVAGLGMNPACSGESEP